MNKKVIPIIILDIIMFLCYFLAYGPISNFKVFVITSSMTTKNHKYIARTLYSEKTIAKVLSQNKIDEVNENTDDSEIDFEKMKEKDKYDSKYEEEVLKRDDNDLYKIVELTGTGYKGYMVVVYDSSRISLASTKYLGSNGQIARDIAKNHKAKIAINAGGFADAGGVGSGGIPTGTVISDGKVIYQGGATGWGGGLIGFNDKNVLVLTKENANAAIKNGMRDAVEFGPFLIVNGKSSYISGNGGGGIASRTVIAQRKDGIVLFFVIDGRQPGYSVGINMAEMTKLAKRYGAYNAANLDGGASTVLIENYKLINRPCGIGGTGERRVPNAWIVK